MKTIDELFDIEIPFFMDEDIEDMNDNRLEDTLEKVMEG